jgi:hypothetical protein
MSPSFARSRFLLDWHHASASHPSLPSTTAYCPARRMEAPPPRWNHVEKPPPPIATVSTTPLHPFLKFGPRLTSMRSLRRCRTRHHPAAVIGVPPLSKNATVMAPLRPSLSRNRIGEFLAHSSCLAASVHPDDTFPEDLTAFGPLLRRRQSRHYAAARVSTKW